MFSFLEGTRTEEILNILREMAGESTTIKRINGTQKAIAEKLGMSKICLVGHLLHLRNHGLINTGMGFIDINEERVMEYLKNKGNNPKE